MIDIDKAVRELLADLEGSSGKSLAAACSVITPRDVPGRLEHSLLTAGLTRESLLEECRVARTVFAAAVCVAPYYVADAVKALAGSPVAVCAAVGFPNAFLSTEAKVADVRSCIMHGASEIDLAINVAAVKSGDLPRAERDFLNAADAARGHAVVKAVFEHGSYNAREKEEVLRMIERSGIPYIKIQNMTSGHGARCEEISLVKGIWGNKVKIKIDGGVKTLGHAIELLRAGAHRIGLTATKAVAEESMKESERVLS